MTIARGPSRAHSDGAAVARRKIGSPVLQSVRPRARRDSGELPGAACRKAEYTRRPPRHLQQNRLFKRKEKCFFLRNVLMNVYSGRVRSPHAQPLSRLYTVTTVTRYALCTGSILCNVLHMVHRMATTPLPCCIATCDHAHLISPRPLTHPSNRSAAMDAPDACSSSSPPALLLLLLSSSPPLQLYFFSAAAAGVSFKS